MPNTAIAILIVVLIILAYIVCSRKCETKEYSANGYVVNVISDYENAQDAVRVMTIIDERMLKFLEYLRVKYNIGITDSECDENCQMGLNSSKRRVVDALLRGFNYEVIHENKPDPDSNGDNTAYSVGKGKTIMLCIRNHKKPLELIDIDTLMFVLLHECAHIAAYDVWGHPERFWSIFKFLLVEAKEVGIHDPIDYSASPVNYCGFNLRHNPYFDRTIETEFA